MTEDRLATLCKALGNPIRIRIMRHLVEEDRCICGKIVEILPLAQSTVSQHLKILKEAGLVQGEISGPMTCYCVNKETVKQLGSTILTLLSSESERGTDEYSSTTADI